MRDCSHFLGRSSSYLDWRLSLGRFHYFLIFVGGAKRQRGTSFCRASFSHLQLRFRVWFELVLHCVGRHTSGTSGLWWTVVALLVNFSLRAHCFYSNGTTDCFSFIHNQYNQLHSQRTWLFSSFQNSHFRAGVFTKFGFWTCQEQDLSKSESLSNKPKVPHW